MAFLTAKTQTLCESVSSIYKVVLTQVNNENTRRLSIKSSVEELVQSIGNISNTEANHLIGVVNAANRNTLTESNATPPRNSPLFALSNREIDVLTLIASGYSRREIGAALSITPNTASSHIANIYRKLNISTIAEATHSAIRHGVVKLMY